jgi:hypothetical protein
VDIQQLNAIGKDIAQTVSSTFDFDDIAFHARTHVHDAAHFWAFCFFRFRDLNHPPYYVPSEVIEQLLALPDEQAIEELRLLIEAQAQADSG